MRRCTVAVLLLLFSAQAFCGSGATTYLLQSFDGPGIPPGWTVHQISGPLATWNVVGTGTNPPIPPYRGTGQAQFNSYDAGAGEQARLTSPRLNLSTATDPFLEFAMYHDDEFPTSLDSVAVEISVTDSITGPWTILRSLRRPEATPGWRAEVISLMPVTGASRVFVSFRGISRFGNNMYIDEVKVADSSFHDIGVVDVFNPLAPGLSPPPSPLSQGREPASGRSSARVTPFQIQPSLADGSSLDLNVVVQNFGTFAEPAYEVRWTVNGQAQVPALNASTLQRNSSDTLTLEWPQPEPGMHEIVAWTALAADSNRANDTTRAMINVLDSTTVFFEGFNSGTFPPPGWVTINRDGGTLPAWFQGSGTSAIPPYEGGGFAANNFQRSNGPYLDDYLITPPVTGVGQTGNTDSLVFRVRSVFNAPPAPNYPDSLMVLLSTTGADTSDFTILLDYFEVPKGTWARRQYLLSGMVPSNSTIRVAFRYLHYTGGPSGTSSDFVGIDAVQVLRTLATHVREERKTPTQFALHQNFPNPFNPETAISVELPAAGVVRLEVFDLLGRNVGTILWGERPAGVHTVRFDATGLASGMYFYRVEVTDLSGGQFITATRKMAVLR